MGKIEPKKNPAFCGVFLYFLFEVFFFALVAAFFLGAAFFFAFFVAMLFFYLINYDTNIQMK